MTGETMEIYSNAQKESEEKCQKTPRNPQKPLRRRKSEFEEEIRPGSAARAAAEASQYRSDKPEKTTKHQAKSPRTQKKKQDTAEPTTKDLKSRNPKKPLKKKRSILKKKNSGKGAGVEGEVTEDSIFDYQHVTCVVDVETEEQEDEEDQGDETESVFHRKDSAKNTIENSGHENDADCCSQGTHHSHSAGDFTSMSGSAIASDDDVFDIEAVPHNIDSSIPDCPIYSLPNLPSEKTIAEFDLAWRKDGYTWHAEDHSSNIIINDVRPYSLVRAQSKNSTDAARGYLGYQEGRHVFEIKYKGKSWGTHCSVGACTAKARMRKKGYVDLLGRDAQSWGWDIPSRELFHRGQAHGQFGEAETLEPPATIGLILDMDKGTLSLYLNKQYSTAKVVFEGLKEIGQPIYPAVSLVYPGAEVRIKLINDADLVKMNTEPEMEEVHGLDGTGDSGTQQSRLEKSAQAEEDQQRDEVVEERSIKNYDGEDDGGKNELNASRSELVDQSPRSASRESAKTPVLPSHGESAVSSAGSVREDSVLGCSKSDERDGRVRVEETPDTRVDVAFVGSGVKKEPQDAIGSESRSGQSAVSLNDGVGSLNQSVTGQTDESNQEDTGQRSEAEMTPIKQIDSDSVNKFATEQLSETPDGRQSHASSAEVQQTEESIHKDERASEKEEEPANEMEQDTGERLSNVENLSQTDINDVSDVNHVEQKCEDDPEQSRQDSHENVVVNRCAADNQSQSSTGDAELQVLVGQTEEDDPERIKQTSPESFNGTVVGRLETPFDYQSESSTSDGDLQQEKKKVNEVGQSGLTEETMSRSDSELSLEIVNLTQSRPSAGISQTNQLEQMREVELEPKRLIIPDKVEELTDCNMESDAERIVKVSDLPDGDQYSLQIAHGWHSMLKGAKVTPYPGIPYICMPDHNFGEKYQAIRSRRVVKSGCHTWRIRELVTHQIQKDAKSDGITGNNLVIGIVNGEHRTFNYGYSFTQIGRHAWGWEPRNRRMWNGAVHKTFPDTGHGEEDDATFDVDFSQGMYVIFDATKKTLHFRTCLRGIEYDASHCYPFYGKDFSIFIVFKGRGISPVKVEYISGPQDHIDDTLNYVNKLKKIDYEDFINFRSISSYLIASSSTSILEEKFMNNFRWGCVSNGVSLLHDAANEANLHGNGKQVVISSFPLSKNRHTIDITFQSVQNVTIGLISQEFSKEGLLADPSILGRGLSSWSWSVKDQRLHHAGETVGRYPYMIPDFELSNIYTLRIVLTFTAAENLASFSLLGNTRVPVDLGIAFLNLPSTLWLVATGEAADDANGNGSVKVAYKSGPTGFVQELADMSSRVCQIL